MQKNKKLKKNNRNRNRNQSHKLSVKKKLALAGLIGFFLIGTGAAGWLLLKKDEAVQLSQAEQREVEQVDSERAKKEAEDSRLSISGDPLKDGDVGEQTPEPPSGGEAVLSQPTFEQTGGIVRSSVNVSGVTGGECIFSFTDKDGRKMDQKVKIGGGICSVELSEAQFTQIGEWNLAVSVGSKRVERKINIT